MPHLLGSDLHLAAVSNFGKGFWISNLDTGSFLSYDRGVQLNTTLGVQRPAKALVLEHYHRGL